MQNIKKLLTIKQLKKIKKRKKNFINFDKPFNFGLLNLVNQSNKIKVSKNFDRDDDGEFIDFEKSDPLFALAEPLCHQSSKGNIIITYKMTSAFDQ